MDSNLISKESILIVGLGFITKNYIDYCLNFTNYKLTIITSKKNAFKNYLFKNRIKFIYTNYEPSNTLKKKITSYQYNILILSGWNTNNLYLKKDNPKNIISNIDFNIWLVNLFIKNGGKYILGLGSCAEYLPSLKCSELDFNLSISTNYAKEKNILQNKIKDIKSQSDIKFGWLRIFAPFGKYEKKESLIFKLLKSSLYGDNCDCIRTERKRDYIFVNDIINIINLMIIKNYDGVLNGGNGKANNIYDLIDIFKTTFNQEPCINWIENKNLENSKLFNSSWVSSTEKLFKSLPEYKPTAIKEGLIIYSKELIQKI